MTTNQTINGVPRELLENCASYMEGSASGTVRIWHDRLRALLDAPVEQFSPQGWSIDHTAGRPILMHNNCSVIEAAQAYGLLELIKSAAQPQHGEPVAWLNVSTGHVTTSAIVVMDWDDEKEQVQSLYAEQPAPVEGDPIGSFDRHMEYMAENIRLKAENETLRKKAERYNWIANQAETESYGGCEWALPLVNAWDFKPGPQLNEQFKTFDDAIDAAMREDDND